jgi:hypothetical protein
MLDDIDREYILIALSQYRARMLERGHTYTAREVQRTRERFEALNLTKVTEPPF